MARLRIMPVTAPRVVAPAGVWFEAVDVTGFAAAGTPRPEDAYDPSFHEITYIWSIEGRPLKPFDAPDNMIPDWNDPNRAYGKQVAFFFPDPGRYVITVRARDRAGTEAVAEHVLEVEAGDPAYPGPLTVAVSFDPDETWAGAPAECQRAGTARDLEAALNKATRPLRLLFKRGQSFALKRMRIEGRPLGQLDAWGAGAAPVLHPTEGGTSPLFQIWRRSEIDQLTIANLHFKGSWDASTETGLSTSSPFVWSASPTPCHYTIWGCRFDGLGHVDVEINKEIPGTILIGNSVVTNWRNYGFLMRSGKARFALSGMQVAQHPDALHGGLKHGAMSNNHGPLRIPDCRQVYIGTSDFFSRSGWSGLAGERADQPCLRLNTGGKRGSAFNLDRIVCEGGYQVINLEGANPRVEENPGNYLIDKALLIGTAKTIGPFIGIDFGGLTVRNMLGIMPDVPARHPNRWQGTLRTVMDNPGPGNQLAPLAFYSSTALNLRDRWQAQDKPWQVHRGGEAFLNTTLENLIHHDGPRGESGVDLSRALPGITPRYRGVRYNFTDPDGKLVAAVAPGGSFEISYRDITEDRPGVEGTGPTNQQYWLETEARDRNHMLWVKGVRNTLYAALGDFRVDFGRRGVVITNLGEKPWDAGAKFAIRLDRLSRLPPMDTAYASPGSLPLPLPDPARHTHAGGLLAEDDFFGRPRGATPSQGAVEPL